jgi:hypothetical protein
MNETLTVDDLVLEVRRSDRRKALEIILDRHGALIIASPSGVGTEVMTAFVEEKRFWIYTKIAEKDIRQQPVAGQGFTNGERFPYLGRSYRLSLVEEQDVPLKLEKGRFTVLSSRASEGRELFISWYRTHATRWLRRRVQAWRPRMGVQPTSVKVRDLGFRWGSCTPAGTLNFHWATILLPAKVVDYVVVHELAHLREMNHTPAFWQRVGQVLPEYEQRRLWLAEHGGRHLVL